MTATCHCPHFADEETEALNNLTQTHMAPPQSEQDPPPSFVGSLQPELARSPKRQGAGHVMWQPGWEGSLAENAYMCM